MQTESALEEVDVSQVTRRGFLKVSSAAVSAAALAGCYPKNPAPATAPLSAPAGEDHQSAIRSPQSTTGAPAGEDSRIQRLTGTWKLLPDPENRGRNDRWFAAVQEGAKPAPVPGMIQQVFPYYGVAWYWHEFTPACLPTTQSKVLLHFDGSVDYLGEVWLNGQFLGGYEGGEAPFDLDATAALKPGTPNLLAVRVLDPINDPIDGYVLKEVPHRNKEMSADPGASSNYGGIMQPVELRAVPVVRIADAFVRPNPHDGRVPVTVTLRNDTGKAVEARLVAAIGPASAEERTADAWAEQTLTVAPGDQTVELELRVEQPRLWDISDPYLYRVTLRLEAGTGDGVAARSETGQSEYRVKCGFREFRVDEHGYFRLNGRRVYVRSAHTGNRWPPGQTYAGKADTMRLDLIYAKAAGFNTIRFLVGIPLQQQLDFCDELGLMVYEECYASWLLADSPKMAERFDRNTDAMVLRDRNHPSVVIWGLLNETEPGAVFQHAVAYLPHLRKLDPTRLVLLGSGRFDHQWNVGSVSNPGSDQWEYLWGAEGPQADYTARVKEEYPLAFYDGVGDAHMYPRVPQSPAVNRLIRTLGQDTKPVFLSEYGIGSLLNPIREAARWEEAGHDPSPMRVMADKLIKDWQAWGFDEVYPFPEDLLRESQRLHARQRLLGFNLIRSNPRICGYSLTSYTDGMTGEGLWTYSGEWKPGIVDALADGWAPLRWCLFVEPSHVYAGQKVQVEAVLANDSVLSPGSYPVTFRIWGPEGLAWEKKTEVVLPVPAPGEDPPLAVPALLEEIALTGPAGAYQLVANMERGGAPAGARLTFYLSDPAAWPRLKATVTGWGLSASVSDWLVERGVEVHPFATAGGQADGRDLLLVGTPAAEESDPAHWTELAQRIARGSTAVFLTPAALKKSYQQLGWLPLPKKGFFMDFFDWLYHKECVAKAHPIFTGLQARGIMDWDYYGVMIPRYMFTNQKAPDEVIAAAFTTGYPTLGGYASGILLGAYRFGAGRFVVNAFRILDYLTKHPAADRLLLNIIADSQRYTAEPLAPLPANWEQMLAEIEYNQ
ncbi:MAG: twin-arginine translocation signal domain-containing protein [Chloroflexi bacterium]|nr:twin-arginine translocation signal domain-containing protein [Chloroflexota bacterium]